MKSILFRAIVLIFAAFSATHSGFAYDISPFGPIAWRSTVHNRSAGLQGSYFTQYPPVYYSLPINPIHVAAKPSAPCRILNPFCDNSPIAEPIPAPKPLRFDNPYVVGASEPSEIAERIRQAIGRKPLIVYPATAANGRS